MIQGSARCRRLGRRLRRMPRRGRCSGASCHRLPRPDRFPRPRRRRRRRRLRPPPSDVSSSGPGSSGVGRSKRTSPDVQARRLLVVVLVVVVDVETTGHRDRDHVRRGGLAASTPSSSDRRRPPCPFPAAIVILRLVADVRRSDFDESRSERRGLQQGKPCRCRCRRCGRRRRRRRSGRSPICSEIRMSTRPPLRRSRSSIRRRCPLNSALATRVPHTSSTRSNLVHRESMRAALRTASAATESGFRISPRPVQDWQGVKYWDRMLGSDPLSGHLHRVRTR